MRIVVVGLGMINIAPVGYCTDFVNSSTGFGTLSIGFVNYCTGSADPSTDSSSHHTEPLSIVRSH